MFRRLLNSKDLVGRVQNLCDYLNDGEMLILPPGVLGLIAGKRFTYEVFPLQDSSKFYIRRFLCGISQGPVRYRTGYGDRFVLPFNSVQDAEAMIARLSTAN